MKRPKASEVGYADEDWIGYALTMAGIPLESVRLRTGDNYRLLLYWAKFSLEREGALLARCASEDQRSTVAKRLLEYRSIVLASRLAGEDE